MTPPLPTRSPYDGARRKLIIAFDIGTTFSGVSYSILDPRAVPVIKGVTRFPCQEQVGGDSKIPTIIYYDKTGKVRAVGAEAVKEGLDEIIEDEGWTKAEWFKLHLRPKSSESSSNVTQNIPPLPKGKTVIDLFADFMKYLHDCTRTYIQDTHANGIDLWAAVEKNNDIDFVLTHPNGWEGAQQAQMRRAAVRAGLVPNTNAGRARVHFVTEGEASLHFCIQSGLATTVMEHGEGILVVDAGGGTIDLSAYGSGLSGVPSSFQEIAAPQCFFQGSVFVSRHARSFIQIFLRDSKYESDVDHITVVFDKTTKLRFRDSNEPQYVKFGTARDKDLKLGIRSGQLKLAGSDVASFFEASVNCIVQAILEQRKASKTVISSVFLVGGFAASDWLFSQIKNSLEHLGINFSRPDSHVNKAVADGGVSYFIDHFVTTRVSKYAYGTPIIVKYDKYNEEHVERASSIFVNAAGDPCISGRFSIILPKDTQVSETEEFRQDYKRLFSQSSEVPKEFELLVMCYKGVSDSPCWIDKDKKNYTMLCRAKFDGGQINNILKATKGPGSKIYYALKYKIILAFGLTELAAQVCWEDANGQEYRSPAEIVYDHDIISCGA